MSDIVETVVVVRKDHPDGKVEINKSDLTEKDVLYHAASTSSHKLVGKNKK